MSFYKLNGIFFHFVFEIESYESLHRTHAHMSGDSLYGFTE